MAQSQHDQLNEIARRLRKLDCICENTSQESSLVIEDYQVKTCDGSNIGSPLNVMPVVVLNKQLVEICSPDASVTYDIPGMIVVPISSAFTLADLGLDVTKLHLISFSVLTGTVSISGNLAGSSQVGASLPVGVNSGWVATTVFGTGDITFTTDGTGTVLVTSTSKA